MSTEQEPNSLHLDQIINCVKQVHPKDHIPANKLQNLFGEAGELIKNFQTNINRCKRYNQAKINRKYEIIINDLENQVKKLSQKLKIQQDARSPTKKHVSDILDQLVIYKQQNQKLKKQLNQYKAKVNELQDKSQNQVAAIKRMQHTQPKALIQRLPALNAGLSVHQSIKQYLKDKQNVRKVIANSEKSSLQKFLHQQQAKAWNWTIGNLLEQLDKWSDGVKPNKQVDMWKIRSSVAKSFSQYLDDSQTLTRPASFSRNMLSPLGSSVSQKKQLSKKQSRFSVFGDRKTRNILDSSLS